MNYTFVKTVCVCAWACAASVAGADDAWGLVSAVMASTDASEKVGVFHADARGVVRSGSGMDERNLTVGNYPGVTISRADASGWEWVPDTVFQRERYVGGCSTDNPYGVTYTFTNLTPGARYRVDYFGAETFYGSGGTRIFNLQINGLTVATDVDLGAKGKAKALSYETTADENGRVAFTCAFGKKENAKYGGLALWGLAAPDAPVLRMRLENGLNVPAGLSARNALSVHLESSPSEDGPWTTVAGGLADDGCTVGLSSPILFEAALHYRLVASNGVGVVTGPVTVENAWALVDAVYADNDPAGREGLFRADCQDVVVVDAEGAPVDGASPDGGGANTSASIRRDDSAWAPNAVYQRERYVGGSSVSKPYGVLYTFKGLVPDEPYVVEYHGAETFASAQGSRVFNIFVNDEMVQENFDLIAVGGAKGAAVVRQYPTRADANGEIAVRCAFGRTQNAKYGGLALYGTRAPTGFVWTPQKAGDEVTAVCMVTNALACHLQRSMQSADGPWETVAVALRDRAGTTFTVSDPAATAPDIWYRVVASNELGTVTSPVQAYTSSSYVVYAFSAGVDPEAHGNFAQYDHLERGTLFAGRAFDGALGVAELANPPPEGALRGALEAPALVFNLPNLKAANTYELRLYFNDGESTAAAQRVMDVKVNGTQVATGLDVFGETGEPSKVWTWAQTGLTPDENGCLRVEIVGTTGRAIVSALELVEENADKKPLKPVLKGAWRMQGGVALAVAAQTGTTTYEIRRRAPGTEVYETVTAACGGNWIDVGADGTALYSARAIGANGARSDWTEDVAVTTEGAPRETLRIAEHAVDADGRSYEPYALYLPGWLACGHGNPKTSVAVSYPSVTDPLPASLASSAWWGSNEPAVRHTITNLVPGASYRIRVHVEDNFYLTSGSRRFSCLVNGVAFFTNMDPSRLFGSAKGGCFEGWCRANLAGDVFVELVQLVQNPQISAIELFAEEPRALSGLDVRYASDYGQTNEAFRVMGTSESLALDWRTSRPSDAPETGNCVEWSGWLLVPEATDYTFTIEQNGWGTLFLDDTGVLRREGSAGRPASASVFLGSGIHRIRYRYEQTGATFAEVRWSSAHLPERVVGAPYVSRTGDGQGVLDAEWNLHLNGNVPNGGAVYTHESSLDGTPVWRFAAGGSDFYSSQQDYVELWKLARGEFELKMRVLRVSTEVNWPKVGVMVRTKLQAQQSAYLRGIAFGTVRGGGNAVECKFAVECERENAANPALVTTASVADLLNPPYWVRVRRERGAGGYVVKLDHSADGRTWTTADEGAVTSDEEVYACVFFSGHTGTATGVADVDHVEFRQYPPAGTVIYMR